MKPIVYHSYHMQLIIIMHLDCSQKSMSLIYKYATIPIVERNCIFINLEMSLKVYHSYITILLIVIIHLQSSQKSLPSIYKCNLSQM